MKTLFHPLLLKLSAIAALALLVTSTSRAASGLYNYVQLGEAGSTDAHNWAIFNLGTNAADFVTVSGASTIYGSIAAAGTGNVSFAGASKLFNMPGSPSPTNGGIFYQYGGTAKPTGGATTDRPSTTSTTWDAVLRQGVIDAKNASIQASSYTSSNPGMTTLSLTNRNDTTGATVTTADDALSLTAPNGGRYVLTLQDFVLNNSTLTLNGDAYSVFIFNIAGTFSMGRGTIVLGGTVRASNVLFNYTGTSNISIASSTFNGVILAAAAANYNKSTVTVSGSTLTGQIIANKVTVSGGSTITTVISPY